MSGLYTLQLNDSYEPGDNGQYHEAFLVHTETDRKAWTTVQKYIRENGADNDSAEDWLKSSGKVVFKHIGEAEEGVETGILLVSYID